MLRLDDVHVHYGRIAAVQGISLTVNQGEFVSVVGHNGAGKSTTLLAITGVLKPVRGEISFEGQRIAGESPERIIRRGISLVPEGRQIFTRLTVGENLRIGSSIRSDRKEVRESTRRLLERFPVLSRYLNSPAGRLSGGEQQQLAIARALLSSPRLLLLDEPSLGLAPLLVEEVFRTLSELRSEGVTILLVEQNAAQAIAAADRSYVLKSGGQVVFQGTREEIAKIADFEKSYLGFN